MKARGDEYCFTCEQTTKYKCIACSAPVCNRCSEPELNEEVDGWRAGKSVGYCNECHIIKLRAEGAEGFTNFVDEGSISGTPCGVPSATTQADKSDINTEERASKLGSSKKRSGRKTQWSDQVIDDFVDIIASSEYYQRKLVFTNTKNQQNGVIYGNILVELQKRCEERGEILSFTVIQLRNKFKKCISECKHVAMTIKTATGIKRFQEDKGYSSWFQQLFPLVQSRDSCQPEMAIEPSSSSLESSSNSLPASNSNSPPASSDHPQPNDDVEECNSQFIPMIKKRRLAKKDSKDHVAEAVSLLKQAIDQNPTKELVSFMKEEAEKSRQHELEVLKLLLNSSPQQHQQIPPQPYQVPQQYKVPPQQYQVPHQYQVPQQYQVPSQQYQFPSTYHQHDPQHQARSHDGFTPQTQPNSNPDSPESLSKQYHTL